MTAPKTVLVLRTCPADMTSHNGRFAWPEKGPVVCDDWDPTPECGGGLHGLLWGEGDGSLLNWSPYARWLVVRVAARDIVDLGCKVKFARGTVVHCGDRLSATTWIANHGGEGRAIAGGTATAGHYGTATAGYGGTSTAGDGGTSTAGYGGTIVITWWDGKRYRLAVGYVGEDGIEADVAYVVRKGKLVDK